MTEQSQQSEYTTSSSEESVISSMDKMEGLLERAQSLEGTGQVDTEELPTETTVTGLRRVLYLLLAGVFFLLGAAGAVLPGLPTTPFLLLTSFFLMKTSPRLNAMLLRSPMFGPILQDWQQRKGVRPDVKFQAIAILVLFVSVALYFAQPNYLLTGTICSGALIGILVILRLPEISKETEAPAEDS